MKKVQLKTKSKEKPNGKLADELNKFAARSDNTPPPNIQTVGTATDTPTIADSEDDSKYQEEISDVVKKLFNHFESKEFILTDFQTEVPVNSLESKVGYTSLIRQMHHAYISRVAFYRSQAGGSLTIEQARAEAFHPCTNKAEARKEFNDLLCLRLDTLNFVDLQELHSFAPRVAEGFWEMTKLEGRSEFESGHLAANITFPVGYMKGMWNIARYLGVRESFIDDWKPKGGIEIAMVDMLAQSWFQWQYWLEQTVKRSETRERLPHPDYAEWLARRDREFKANGWTDGFWNRPYVSEQQALDSAVQMADRFNRIFMRTLRQLRDLRRYSPVTINNPNQVNIAAEGGQQVNLSSQST